MLSSPLLTRLCDELALDATSRAAVATRVQNGAAIAEALLDVSDDLTVATALSSILVLRLATSPAELAPEPHWLTKVPLRVWAAARALPLKGGGKNNESADDPDVIAVAVADPLDSAALDAVRVACGGILPQVVVAPRRLLHDALREHLGVGADTVQSLVEGKGEEAHAEVDLSDAAEDAQQMGFPVTIKTSSTSIAHKTEAGGVALSINSPAEAEAAARTMMRLGPEVLVERMVKGAVAELIIGLKNDPQFGLALVIGAGGILTELLKDSAALLLPTSREEITRALHSLKVWKLVEGYRGKSGDQQAVIESIAAVVNFAASYGAQIEELDVNPLLVLADGAIAVDALIRMRRDNP